MKKSCPSYDLILVLIGTGGALSFMLGRAEPILVIALAILFLNEITLFVITLVSGIKEREGGEEGAPFFLALELLLSSLHINPYIFLFLCWFFSLTGLYRLSIYYLDDRHIEPKEAPTSQ